MAGKTHIYNVRVEGTDKIAANFAKVDIEGKKINAEMRELRKTLLALEKGGKGSEKLRKEMAKQGKTVGELRGEYARLTKAQFEVREKRKRLGQEMRNHSKDLEVAEDSVFGLRKKLNELRRTYDRLGKEAREGKVGQAITRDINKVHKEVSEAEQATGRFQRNVGNYRSALTGMGDEMLMAAGVPPQLSMALSGLSTSAALAGGAVAGAGFAAFKSFKSFAELEDVMADVQKTTSLTYPEVDRLKDELYGLNTRTSIEGLLAISKGAGRLGVEGVDNLRDFTQSVDKLTVALGDDLGGDSEAIATTIGKIVDIFDLDEEFGLSEALERVGSVVNELANTTKAQAGPVVDFIQRLQGLAAQTNITVQELAALGATLDAAGQPTERSATAVQRFISRVASAPEKFAAMAKEVGVTNDRFAEMTRKAPVEALLSVLDAGQSSAEGLAALDDIVTTFGITSEREKGVILALSKNVDTWRENIDTANRSMADNISLQNEFNNLNDTSQAKLDKLGKAWSQLWNNIGQGAAVVFNPVLDWMNDAMQSGQQYASAKFWSDIVMSWYDTGEAAEDAADKTEKAAARSKESGKEIIDEFIDGWEENLANWNPMDKYDSDDEVDFWATENGKRAAEQFTKSWKDELGGENLMEDIHDAIWVQEGEDDMLNRFLEQMKHPYVMAPSGGGGGSDLPGGGATKTYKELKDEANALQAEIRNLAASQETYTGSLKRYREIQARINEIDSIFNTKDSGRKMAVMAGSLKGLTETLGEVNEQMGAIDPEQDPAGFEELAAQSLALETRIQRLKERTEDYKETLQGIGITIANEMSGLGNRPGAVDSLPTLGIGEVGAVPETVEDINARRFDSLRQLHNQYLNGLIEDEEEYLRLKERINQRADLEVIQNKLENENLSEEKRAELLAQQAALRVDIEKKADEQIKENRVDTEREIVQAAFEIAQQAASAIFSIQKRKNQERLDAALDNLEAEYDRRIERAEGNEELQDRLREERAEKEEQMKREAFEKEKELAVKEALINGAIAITKALATLGPIAGPIAAAVIGATTALQVAEIKSRSFRFGGMTDGDGLGFGDQHGEFKGYVHEKEYVAPQEQLAQYPDLFNWLERDRKRRFNGFRFGGFTTPEAPIVVNPNSVRERQFAGGMSDEDINKLARAIGGEVGDNAYEGSKQGTREGTREARKRSALEARLIQNTEI